MNSFYSYSDLIKIGLKNVGINVKISKFAKFYGVENIKIGNNVRIDDYCILSGKITLGDFIHISAGSYMFAGEIGIEMKDFSGLSSRSTIYAVSDDYSGEFLTNPTTPFEFRNVISKKVVINKHVIIGTGSIILPGVVMGEGSASGAMTLINKSIDPWKICVGIPAKIIGNRNKGLLEKEKKLLNENHYL